MASKATGYPIVKVAKIAVGMTLDQITNAVTGETKRASNQHLTMVTKFPRWPFEKFNLATALGTQMKATGEVMAIDRTWKVLY